MGKGRLCALQSKMRLYVHLTDKSPRIIGKTKIEKNKIQIGFLNFFMRTIQQLVAIFQRGMEVMWFQRYFYLVFDRSTWAPCSHALASQHCPCHRASWPNLLQRDHHDFVHLHWPHKSDCTNSRVFSRFMYTFFCIRIKAFRRKWRFALVRQLGQKSLD